MARRLAIRLYWMWRERRDYEQQRGSVRTQGQPESSDGVYQNTDKLIVRPAPLRGGV